MYILAGVYDKIFARMVRKNDSGKFASLMIITSSYNRLVFVYHLTLNLQAVYAKSERISLVLSRCALDPPAFNKYSILLTN